MNAIRVNKKNFLAVALGAMMLASFSPAASGRSTTTNCNNLGRGNGYPVAIHVMFAGKAVASAEVTVTTPHGVPVGTAETDSLGVVNAKLSPGTYIVTAKTRDASGKKTVTVTKKSSAAVTVNVTPNR